MSGEPLGQLRGTLLAPRSLRWKVCAIFSLHCQYLRHQIDSAMAMSLTNATHTRALSGASGHSADVPTKWVLHHDRFCTWSNR